MENKLNNFFSKEKDPTVKSFSLFKNIKCNGNYSNIEGRFSF